MSSGGGIPFEPSRSLSANLAVIPRSDTVVAPRRGDTPYPILTLPTEITVEIFTHCLPDEPCVPRTDTAPLLLGRICRTWREISLATPELWSFLQIILDDAPEARHVDFVEIWLSRAQNWPLTLMIDCFDSTAQDIEMLKRYSHLWRNVALGLRFNQFSLFGSDLHLPMLERLAIVASDFPYAVESPVTVFRSTPALRHLQLQDSILPINTVLPWAQLTSFESDAQSAVECMEILRCMPNLVHCVLNIHVFADPNDLGDVPPLMFLASLRISSHWWGVLSMLHHISVPALQKLDLTGVVIDIGYFLQPLREFLSRPGYRLRELSIQLKEVDESIVQVQDVIDLLETQPALEKLQLCDASLEVLTEIFFRLSDGSLLPRLRHFSASIYIVVLQQMFRDFSGMLDALVTALWMRWVAPMINSDITELTRIHNCTVTYTRRDMNYIAGTFQPRLDELTAKGMKIHVGIQPSVPS